MNTVKTIDDIGVHLVTGQEGKVTLVFDDSMALRRMTVEQARELAQCLLDAACDVERNQARQAPQSVLQMMG